MRRFAPLFLIAMFGLVSLSCMAVNRTLFGEPPTSTPIPPTLTALPTSTPLPSPTPTLIPTITPTPDTCPNGDCITACVNQLHSFPKSGGAGGESNKMRRSFDDNVVYTLVTYAVVGDQIKNPVDEQSLPPNLDDYQKDQQTQQRI